MNIFSGRIFSQIVEKREENREEEFSAFDAFVDMSVSREPNSFQIFRVSVWEMSVRVLQCVWSMGEV